MTAETKTETTTHTATKKKVVASVITSTIDDGEVSRKRRFLGGSLPRTASADRDASEGWPTFYDKFGWAFDFEDLRHYEANAYFWRTERAKRYHAIEWDSLQVEQITETVVTDTTATTTLERVQL